MDLGVEGRCDFEERPNERNWVTGDPDTIEPPEQTITCDRDSINDADYCPFHLSQEEQEAHDIDTGELLREKLQEVAQAKSDSDEKLDFRGAYLSAADLSNIDFGDMSGFDIDLRYADIEGSVDLSDVVFSGTVNCQFIRCDDITAVGSDIRKLDCSEATLRNRSATSMGSDERALSLRRSASFGEVSLTGADVAGNVYFNQITVERKIEASPVFVEGSVNLTVDASRCDISGIIDRKLIIDGSQIETLDCSSTVAEKAKLQHLKSDESETKDQIYTVNCNRIDAESLEFQEVAVDQINAESLSVQTLKLENVTVTENASFLREEDIPSELTRLRVTGCEFHGKTQFDRLSPATAFFDFDRATADVSFEHFECHDITFNPGGYPMFEADVNFKEADLQGAILRHFEVGGRAIFTNADLTDARLLNANLSGAVLEGALLSRARLVGTNLKNAYLYHATLSDANIDMSTVFGELVIYDPNSEENYDSSLGIDADGGVSTTSDKSTGDAAPDIPYAQMAKEVYHSIHNSARQSGNSDIAIKTYRKYQEMETILLKDGDVRADGWLPQRLQWLGRKFYGWVTGYGVGTRRLIIISLSVILLSLLSLFITSGNDLNTLSYGVGGFVGATPGFETTLLINLIIGFEALAGALLIALYVNALGRRSSM
jgi:uncharacterized protein YjbI with pentapeptide repeats